MKDFKVSVSYDKNKNEIKFNDGINFSGVGNIPDGLRILSYLDVFLLENGYLDEDGYVYDDGIEYEEGED